jgi:hypothetical protein
LADFFIYGDFRDLVVQTFSSDPDEFIRLLSFIGIGTSAFTYATAGGGSQPEIIVNLLKIAKKIGALSEPMVKYLTRTFKFVADNAKVASMAQDVAAEIKKIFIPVSELLSKLRSFVELKTIMKHAGDIEQLKVLVKMASGTQKAARQLTQILLVAGSNSKATINFMMKYGQKGMDSLHAALRKGPKGLKFIMENSTLIARSTKNVRKGQVAYWDYLKDGYRNLLLKYGNWIVLAQYIAIILIPILIFILWIPKKVFKNLPFIKKGLPKVMDSQESKNINSYAYGVTVGTLGLAIALIYFLYSSITYPSATIASTIQAGTEGGVYSNNVDQNNPMVALIIMLLSVIAHFVIGIIVYQKVKSVQSDTINPSPVKLKRLENLDIFFDLPLFCGLLLTILSFILITYNVTLGRTFAYVSTIIGVISAVTLRVTLLYPLKETLTTEIQEQKQ